MTPAEIAAKLTPAQIRALSDPGNCAADDYQSLELFELGIGEDLTDWIFATNEYETTPLGRAVLAALNAKDTP